MPAWFTASVTSSAQGGTLDIRPPRGLFLLVADNISPYFGREYQSGTVRSSVTVNAAKRINGPTTGQTNLSAILAEHARIIAREVQRILQIEYEQEAVV
jgi:hypothetical protein